LIDRMEEDGFISAPNHIGRREVLRDRNGDPV
jgi:S-DNA-T family DNA segregation ATPase FtsK/SpoIIIE